MIDQQNEKSNRIKELKKPITVWEAADRIEQLVKERDAMLRVVTDNHVALQRAEAAEAKVNLYGLKDGMDGAVVDVIRNILHFQGVPHAAFIDDHVANAIVQRNKANNKVSMAVRAIKIALTGWQSELVQYEMTEDLEEMAVVKKVLAELEKTE